ncbi:MAG: FAD-dependent oxidoreductase, partial [Bulleidia sp.]
GLVITGLFDPNIHEGDRSGHPDVTSDDCIPGMSALAQTIHDNGAKACLQLAHYASHGCPRDPEYGWRCVSREGLKAEFWMYTLYPDLLGKPLPHKEYTIDEIHELVGFYGDGARRAKTAGFDFVEVHCANMHGLNLFLSPLSNKRKDEYGGPVENRARIVFEIIDDIQKKCGRRFPILVRLSAEDLVPGGAAIEDTIWIAEKLESMGVAAIDVVSLKSGQGMQVPMGENIEYAARIRKELHIPVMVTGSMNTPDLCEETIRDGKADFVGTGRAAYPDPAWPRKIYEGRPEDIVPCIRCNECMNALRYSTNGPLVCTMNPQLAKENVLPCVKAEKPVKVAVVGGGPAGMEAALVASRRGHQVTLFEKRELGGLVIEAAVPDFKQDLKRMIAYFRTQLDKCGVTVCRKEASAEDLKDFSAVIVCTGAARPALKIEGADGDNVRNSIDVLYEDPDLGSQIVVIGGGSVGVETALFEAGKGCHVTIVEMLDHLMNGENPMTSALYQNMLKASHVDVLTSASVRKIDSLGVSAVLPDGTEKILPADHVITAIGLKPDLSLRDELDRIPGLRVYYAGSCENPKMIFDAIHAGF